MLLPRRTAVRFLVAILLLSTFSPASAFADKSFSLDTARNNLTYVVSQLASFFSDLADAIASHIPVTSLTASAAAPSPTAPPAPAPDFLATTTPEASTPPTTTTASDPPQTTIIQQPVIERIVERTVAAPAASGISEQTLAGRLASLKDHLLLRIAAVASAPIAFSGPAATTPLSTATFAPSQRIDQLTNTAINTPTITGGTISGASVSGYLSLSGGTLTGTLSGSDLNLSGTLTAGALTGPYFTATSTTATSTFAGGLTAASGGFSILQNGNVGIGTAGPQYPMDIQGTSQILLKLTSSHTAGTWLRIANTDTGGTSWNLISTGSTNGEGAGSLLINNGPTRMTLTSAGNVGIGTTTPWGKLSITGSGTGTGLGFVFADSANTPRFVIQDNGNVGIGTESPSQHLHVYDLVNAYGLIQGGNLGGLLFQGTTTSTGQPAYANINTYTDGSLRMQASSVGWVAASNQLTLANSGNVGIGTTTPLSKLDVYGTPGSDTSGLTISGSANSTGRLAIYANGTGSTAFKKLVSNGYISFLNSSGSSELIIDDTGNVSVGAVDGAADFFVSGSAVIGSGYSLNSGATDGLIVQGNVGIGTTTPWGKLSITGSGTGTGLAFAVADSANTPRFVIQDNGNVGIGTTTPTLKFVVYEGGASIQTTASGSVGFNSPGLLVQSTVTAGTFSDFRGNTRNRATLNVVSGWGTTSNGPILNVSNNLADGLLYVDSGGNVGIGTTSPTAQLHTTGTVRFSNFGAGTLTTDASGNLSVSSDERLKNIDGAFSRGLSDIIQLNPIQYHWNATSGLDTSTQYAGFSAQNVQTAIPEAVGSSTNGYLTLQDRPLIATVVNAIKELAQQVSDLAERVVTKEIVAVNGSFRNIRAEELCFGDSPTDESPVCLTKSQVAAVLAAASQSAVSPSPASVGAPQAPVIEINGNATSTIEIGDTYNDLGARIIAPESDLNLGIVVLLEGATTTAVSIDTTAPGEHTILYTVTSPTTGLTSTIMRTVIVSSAEELTVPAEEDTNPFTAPDNDNASSTTAVDVAA